MSDQAHRVLTQASSSAKRKREGRRGSSSGGDTGSSPPHTAAPSNLLLAGYMAHEFLTKGTILGQRWDPAGETWPPPSTAGEVEGGEEERRGIGGGVPAAEQRRSYAEVATLLKTGEGAHVPGIVNPTQLARWIQM